MKTIKRFFQSEKQIDNLSTLMAVVIAISIISLVIFHSTKNF
jgi:hypothetical protein